MIRKPTADSVKVCGLAASVHHKGVKCTYKVAELQTYCQVNIGKYVQVYRYPQVNRGAGLLLGLRVVNILVRSQIFLQHKYM